jgi:hypothetical protein
MPSMILDVLDKTIASGALTETLIQIVIVKSQTKLEDPQAYKRHLVRKTSHLPAAEGAYYKRWSWAGPPDRLKVPS